MRCRKCGVPVSNGSAHCEKCAALEKGRIASADIDSDDKYKRVTLPVKSSATSEISERETKKERKKSAISEQPEAGRPAKSANRPSSPPSPIILEGKYRLMNELGRGAMGTVFLAEEIALQRKVAVKFLLPSLARNAECAERFRREAIGMAAIRDNNVAQIFTFGEYSQSPYFVMEYIEGETLESLIDAHNRRGMLIPLADALEFLIQALSGLSAIHRVGSVHRDIKPGNIMLTSEPARAVIMDFGLVRAVRMEDDLRPMAGTPAYIAPELVEGKPEAGKSPLADIYSMGVTAYETLTGAIPFVGENWIEIVRKHIAEMPEAPSTLRPDLPEKLDNIVLKAMSKEPEERYLDCEQFLEDMLAVQQGAFTERDRRAVRGSKPPVAPGSSRPGGSSPAKLFRSTPRGSRGRLLVADADANFRALVYGAVAAAVPGCRIQSVTDGTMALKLVKEFKPHIMVIDLSLPEINGLEVVATLRGDPTNDAMEIVVVAEKGGREEAEIMRSMRVKVFLNKPIDADALASLLRPMLEKPRPISRDPAPMTL